MTVEFWDLKNVYQVCCLWRLHVNVYLFKVKGLNHKHASHPLAIVFWNLVSKSYSPWRVSTEHRVSLTCESRWVRVGNGWASEAWSLLLQALQRMLVKLRWPEECTTSFLETVAGLLPLPQQRPSPPALGNNRAWSLPREAGQTWALGTELDPNNPE